MTSVLNNKQRKGQFEIMGVAIIIVLLILGFTMYLLLNQGVREDRATTFENEQLAQNIVDTFMRTQIGPACRDAPSATVYELVRDLTILNYGLCDGDIDTTADVIEEAVETIMQETTAIRYNFFILVDDGSGVAPIDKLAITTCPLGSRVSFERTGEQRIRLLPTPSTAIIELQLCP